jgi:hypothetical protein
MTQNINLLTELAIRPISAFNSKLMERVIIAWLLALVLIYTVAFGVDLDKKRSLVNMEVLQKNLLTKVASYNEELALLQEESPLDSKNLPAGFANTTGFYDNLKDLATFTPTGVWLNYISISKIGDITTLEGSTITSSGVSALLDALSKSESFRNKKFNTINLEKKSGDGNTDFTIGNTIIAPTSTTTVSNKK